MVEYKSAASNIWVVGAFLSPNPHLSLLRASLPLSAQPALIQKSPPKHEYVFQEL